MIVKFLALAILCVSLSHQIDWQPGNWARNCDFEGNDIANVLSKRDDCSTKCKQNPACSNYVWTNYKGGTCWLKSGSISKESAVNKQDAVCGINEKSENPVEDLKRNTTSGPIVGTISTDLIAWLGIPYAEPPTDYLRFRAPVPVKPWTAEKITKKFGPSCGDTEDCLTLNIKAPRNSQKLPVLIWIHGGGFTGGSGSENAYVWDNFASQEKVIVVTVQYRLGIFGFLYMGTENAPGNQGLLDQALAIKWVYDNIEEFGGDKTRITIGGASAGAKSAGMHLIMKSSWPYFNNVIMFSGSPNAESIIRTPDKAINNNTAYLKKIGCNGTPEQIVQCALKKSPNSLKSGDTSWATPARPFFSPVVDGKVLTDKPTNILTKGDFKNCSVITGTAKDSDNFYDCPSEQLASFYSKQKLSVYHYKIEGEDHYKDFPKVFTNDKKYGGKLRRYWSNMIKYNDPNYGSPDPQWPTYGNNQAYMKFNTNGFQIGFMNKENVNKCNNQE